jgi:hypothetical protein
MRIKIVKLSREDLWYKDLVGEIFYVFMLPSVPFAFLSMMLYFFPEDVQEVHQGDGCSRIN